LQLLGAAKHLELFQQQCKSQIDELGKDKFFKSKLEGVNPIRDLMNSDTFEIEENLVQLNAAFLKSTLTWKYFRSMICLPHWKNLWGTRLKDIDSYSA
jgi:hypothetical protein